MRAIAIIFSTVALFARQAFGDSATTNSAVATNSSAVISPPEPERAWSGSASIFGYLVPEQQSYAQPTVIADHDWLHLEARYNYEALQTGSAWVGYNFSGGEKFSWSFTPMLGSVFGDLTGIAPGFRGSFGWRKLEFTSEAEFVFDIGNRSQNYIYSWNELTLAPTEWFHFGVAVQRTRAYESDRLAQPGLLVGFTYKHASFTAYVFNVDESKPTVVLGLTLAY